MAGVKKNLPILQGGTKPYFITKILSYSLQHLQELPAAASEVTGAATPP